MEKIWGHKENVTFQVSKQYEQKIVENEIKKYTHTHTSVLVETETSEGDLERKGITGQKWKHPLFVFSLVQ